MKESSAKSKQNLMNGVCIFLMRVVVAIVLGPACTKFHKFNMTGCHSREMVYPRKNTYQLVPLLRERKNGGIRMKMPRLAGTRLVQPGCRSR